MSDDLTIEKQTPDTRVLLASGTDYRTLQHDLAAEDYDYTARAGHGVFSLDGTTTVYEVIIHEPLSADVSVFVGEHITDMAHASPYAA